MRNPEIKIIKRNVTGMRHVKPRNILAIEFARLIMIVALVAIVSLLAVSVGA